MSQQPGKDTFYTPQPLNPSGTGGTRPDIVTTETHKKATKIGNVVHTKEEEEARVGGTGKEDTYTKVEKSSFITPNDKETHTHIVLGKDPEKQKEEEIYIKQKEEDKGIFSNDKHKEKEPYMKHKEDKGVFSKEKHKEDKGLFSKEKHKEKEPHKKHKEEKVIFKEDKGPHMKLKDEKHKHKDKGSYKVKDELVPLDTQFSPSTTQPLGTQPYVQPYAQPPPGTQPYVQPPPGTQPYAQPSPGTQPYAQPSPGTQPYAQPSPGTQPYVQPPPGTQSYAQPPPGTQPSAQPHLVQPPVGHAQPPGSQPYTQPLPGTQPYAQPPLSQPPINQQYVQPVLNQHYKGSSLMSIRNDHIQIRMNLDSIPSLTDLTEKLKVFNDTVKLLSQHDVAEEVVLYSTVKNLGLTPLADTSIDGARQMEKILYEMDNKYGQKIEDVSIFHNDLLVLREAFNTHAVMLETDMLPELETKLALDDINDINKWYDRTKPVAPTRPHPSGPHTATGQLLTGPVLAFVDRFRDLSKKFTQKNP